MSKRLPEIVTVNALPHFCPQEGRMTVKEMDSHYRKIVTNGRKGNALKPLNRPEGGIVETWKDQAKGAIWGMIVGDALGASIEFTDKLGHPWVEEMLPVTNWLLPAGSFTDDSSLGLNIMQTFVDYPNRDDFSVEGVASNFVRWLRNSQWSSCPGETIGIGRSCGFGIERYASNGSIKNGSEESQGNGSIMRYAPSWFIGQKLFCDSDVNPKTGLPLALELDFAINDITHNSSVARKCIARMSAILDLHVNRHVRSSEKTTATCWRDAANSGWCVSTLDSAIWAFNSTRSFEDALVAAVNLGGDSDTIGAVCGQIAGSWYGLSAIPSKWKDAIVLNGKLTRFIDTFVDKVCPFD